MTPGKDLFHLIQSLTMSEKRYINLILKRQIGKEGKNYLSLFDEVAAQKEYDEHAIKKKVAGQIKNFTATKMQLYALVLRTLRLFKSRVIGENSLFENLQNIEILFSKGLYRECGRLIKKAKHAAEFYDNHLVKISLLNWEARIRRELKYENISIQQIDELNLQEKEVIGEYKAVAGYRNVVDRLFHVQFRDAFVRSRKSLQGIYPKSAFAALSDEHLSRSARIKVYFAVAGYYISIGDNERSFIYNQRLVDLLESLPYRNSEVQRHYVNALFNLCLDFAALQKPEDADRILRKIKKLKDLDENNKLTISCFLYYYNGSSLMLKGDFKNAAHLADELTGFISKNDHRIDSATKLTLHYICAFFYFGDLQFSKTIERTNKISNLMRTDRRMDLLLAARVLNILAHIEKENYDVAAYLGKSFHRLFSKNKKSYKIEKALIKFIHKRLYPLYVKLPAPSKAISALFRELKPEIEKLLQDPFERTLLKYIDISSWLDSKIENQPYNEIIRKKAMSAK